MANKDLLAMNRLLKRLSALRATLRKDERTLLDSFILGLSSGAATGKTTSQGEVEAHGMVSGAAMAVPLGAAGVATRGLAAGAAKGKPLSPAEVAAHSMASGAAKGKTLRPAEVAAHGMTSGAAKGQVFHIILEGAVYQVAKE